MRIRRLLLAGSAALLVASAAQRVCAGGPVDVEATGYGGTASGGWACGPDARVQYGGGGGEVRLRPTRSPENPNGEGFYAAAGGAAETRSYAIVRCKETPCGPTDNVVPPGGLIAATHAKVGYDWKYFGVHAGAMLSPRHEGNLDVRPSYRVLPELTLRAGRLDGLRGELGFGSYSIPTLFRPGAFAGVGFVPLDGIDVAVRLGILENFDDDLAGRADVALRARIVEGFQLGAGLALSSGERNRPEPEGRGFLVWTP